MSFQQIKTLRERYAQLVAEGRQLVDRAEAEGRAMTAEEDANWTRCHKDCEEVQARADKLQEQMDKEARVSEFRASAGTIAGQPDSGAESRSPEVDETARAAKALDAYVRRGWDRITEEQRGILEARQFGLGTESRSPMLTTSDTAGGFLVDSLPQERIVKALASFSSMRRAGVTVTTTSTGADLPIPTTDDTSNEGHILGEGQEDGERDVAVGQRTLRAYIYTSDMLPISRVLLNDTSQDIVGMILEMGGERIGRIQNRHFTLGDGANKPFGIVPQAAVGKTSALASAITADELLDLKHSVDPDYRINSPAFMFNDATLLAVKKLKNSSGDYIFKTNVDSREPNTIDGDRYVINQHMASIGSSAKPVLYGDLRFYRVRDVAGIEVLRLNERYAEKGLVTFLMFARADATLINAGTNPVKVLQNAA